MSRRLAVALGVAALGGLAALTLAGSHTTHARSSVPPPPARAIAGPAGPAIVLGPHIVGLSIEYPLLAHDLGAGACPPPALVRTLRSLRSPALRIGGDSQDQTAPPGAPALPGATDLPAGFWARVGCLERETAVPVIVGLNLASAHPAWAAEMARDARSAVPAALLSFELGNEPDNYGSPVPWWNGRELVRTPMPLQTYLARARAVERELGAGAAIEGPDFASGRWIAALRRLALTLHLRTLDAHFYPLDGCRDPAAATAAALAGRAAQDKLSERIRIARIAHSLGIPAVLSEANSVGCGGRPGVSDQPVAGVWALRMVLRALRSGFSAVRFHASGGAYDPFVLAGTAVRVRPLSLGLLTAARLLTPGARLQSIPGAGALDGVAITRPDGTRTVVLSNYAAAAKWVSVAAAAPAVVTRLLDHAPAVTVTLADPVAGRVRVELPGDSASAINVPAAR